MDFSAQKLDSVPERVYTIDEYLERERAAEERSIYLDGRIIAMPGESDAHGDISVNLVGLLGNHLRGNSCRVRTKATKVRSGPTPMRATSNKGMFSYPDLLVICGEVEHHDSVRDVILKPTVVIEVLSVSTENFDRGEKFRRFLKWNPTLRDYMLMAQDQPWIEVYTAQENG